MSSERPIPCTWDGEAFMPRRGFEKTAAKDYVVGEAYTILPYEERSDVSHRHEFAWLKTAWMSLPERLADQFPTPESLRKRALIEAGFFNESITDAGSNAAALRVASAFRAIDEFSLVIVRGALVIRRTAKSQSRRSMPKDEFQRSKEALIEIVSAMIGVTPEQLRKAEAA